MASAMTASTSANPAIDAQGRWSRPSDPKYPSPRVWTRVLGAVVALPVPGLRNRPFTGPPRNAPRVRHPAQADRWTWLVVAAYIQLRWPAPKQWISDCPGNAGVRLAGSPGPGPPR